MTALPTITEEAKKLTEKAFLKTSFLVVLLALFEFAQWWPIIQCNWFTSAFPFILHFKTPNLYTTYAVTIAMLLLLSRGLSVFFDWVNHKQHITERWVLWKKEQDKNARTRNAKTIEDMRNTHEVDQYIVNILLQSTSAYNFLELLNKQRNITFGIAHYRDSKVVQLRFTRRHPKTNKEVRSNIKYAVLYTKELRFESYSFNELLEAYKDHQEELTFAQL